MKITEALLAEHVVFHNLFDYVERAAPRLRTLGEIRTLAGLLNAMQESHGQIEDELVMEPLAHCLDNLGQNEAIHAEHQHIEEVLAQVRSSRDLKQAKKLLHTAVVVSRQHFDREERVIFPLAEKWLKPKTLQTLGSEWVAKRKQVVG
ncbi:MAG: hemerythrin domain-containing protein [Verrucomicrobia bacterium]|nr:hemerythrin domain-containing protein [Verrucomicrobiota bacterium]